MRKCLAMLVVVTVAGFLSAGPVAAKAPRDCAKALDAAEELIDAQADLDAAIDAFLTSGAGIAGSGDLDALGDSVVRFGERVGDARDDAELAEAKFFRAARKCRQS